MDALSTLVDLRLAPMADRLVIEWPGGRAGSRDAAVRLRMQRREQVALLARGDIGEIAEAYVRGELEIDGSMDDVMAVAAELAGDPVGRGAKASWPRWLALWRSRLRHLPERDAKQVQFHYDIDDEFFALWLDPMRVYSCAYFDAGEAMTLAQAQQSKLDLICRKLQLEPGQRMLDVGAGWGALLIWAAEHYGVQAQGVTLSRNQHAHVNRQIEQRGLQGRVQMRLLDYRDLPADERYDRIASVGMFEHVGRAELGRYFDRLARRLRPGGLLLNHGITAAGLAHDQLGAGMGDFIEKHIFPGGELTHVSQVAGAMAGNGLELLDAENLRPHYARTLWAWSAALERRLDEARRLTSEATVRAYRLYLAGSAMCFERGWLSIYQLLAARPNHRVQGGAMRGAQSDYRFTRGHMPAAPGRATG